MSAHRRLPPGAREVVLPNGERRIELVIDIGLDPATGRRRQSRRRFRTVAEARAAWAEIHSAVQSGTHVPRTHQTVSEAAAAWLAGKRNLKTSTRAGYEHALEPVVVAYGSLPVQRLAKTHLDSLVDALTAGTLPRKDGRARRPWTGRTVALSLHVLGQVLDDLVRQGLLTRNVAALVERPRHRATERTTWTLPQVQQFLAATTDDRMRVAWLLALYGLRRGEIAGLRWEHVDLDAGTLSIVGTRLSVGGTVVHDDPKSSKSRRVLPLTRALRDGLRDARNRQGEERDHLGPTYEHSGFIVIDEAGRALHPETISGRFDDAIAVAGVPRIRLHDARHTCASLMHASGEPIAVISAWLGHSSAAFTMRTYVHAQDGALQHAADRIDRTFGIEM